MANEGENCLHGGPGGFHSRVWKVTDAGADHLTLRLTSPDGDQGFPGELTAEVTYRVTATSVHVDLRATTTATTVVNLTNHAYWNLAGEGSGSADGHLLTVEADTYLPVDEQAIPLAHPADLAGTPARPAVAHRRGPGVAGGARADGDTLGVDHCYLLRGEGMRLAARLTEPTTGRTLEVHTDQPGLQVYTGNHLDGSSPAPPPVATARATASRWRPSACPTPPTTTGCRPPCSSRGRSTARTPSGASWGEVARRSHSTKVRHAKAVPERPRPTLEG